MDAKDLIPNTYIFKQEDISSEVKIGIFIPGRLSSERLPQKLILPLNDKGDTLWSIACDKLNNLSDEFVKVALCSDKELIDVAGTRKNIKVIERDVETSSAEGPMSFIFKDLKEVEDVTHWMFLNPCLALLSEETIVRSLKMFKDNPLEFATSVKKYQNWLFDDNANPMAEIDYNTLSTKEVNGLYEAAHAFHIFSTSMLFTLDKNTLMQFTKPGIFVIPKKELVDVDTPEDYEYLKHLLTTNTL